MRKADPCVRLFKLYFLRDQGLGRIEYEIDLKGLKRIYDKY